MRSIKFVQWASSISICIVIFAGLLCLFTNLATIEDWVRFATIAAVFIAPEKLVAFFGNIVKRKQQNGGGDNGAG